METLRSSIGELEDMKTFNFLASLINGNIE